VYVGVNICFLLTCNKSGKIFSSHAALVTMIHRLAEDEAQYRLLAVCIRPAFLMIHEHQSVPLTARYRCTGGGIGESAPFTLFQIISFSRCMGARSRSLKSIFLLICAP